MCQPSDSFEERAAAPATKETLALRALKRVDAQCFDALRDTCTMHTAAGKVRLLGPAIIGPRGAPPTAGFQHVHLTSVKLMQPKSLSL